MDMIHQKTSLFFENFLEFISTNLKLISNGKFMSTLPLVPASFLSPFLKEMKNLFESEPTVLDLDGPFVIVGDLHGHILDLFRIFKMFQSPNQFKYLFLGDLVDRGEFSFETIFFILILKYLHPTSVYIIRGNHEFASICSGYGFLNDIQTLYPNDSVFELFVDIFNYLPLAAILQHDIFCVHGGICPELETIDQIKSIQKPILNFDDPLVEGLVWSDPSVKIHEFRENPRGSGCLFGSIQINNFLQKNSLKMIIRAHQCVQLGVQYLFKNQLVTVFSASKYCGKVLNHSGVLVLKEGAKIEKYSFPYFQYLKRKMIKFQINILSNSLISKTLPMIPNIFEKKITVSPQILSPNLICPTHEKTKSIKRQSYQNLLSIQL
jgi:protein phosphatase